MREEIRFTPDDRIAIIAPHPDDECLGASAALLLAADRTDVFVMTDGSHGNPANTIEEEAVIRKLQFEAEMAYVKPHAWYWLGYEDKDFSSMDREPAPGSQGGHTDLPDCHPETKGTG